MCDQMHWQFDEIHDSYANMNIGSDSLQRLRREDHARYLICLYAPPHKRESLAALSLLNCELARIRDSVSEPMVGEVRLAWWREAIADLYTGKARKHEVLEALAATSLRQHVPHALVDSMIQARIDDIYDAQPASIAMLDDYLGATSGQLQQGLCYLLCDGAPNAATLDAAHHVGRGWGLVGIVRAVGFHARQQRRFIPDEALQVAGIAPEAMVQQPITAALAPALKAIVDHARAAIAAARGLRHDVDPRALPALALASLAMDYAARLEAKGYDPLGFDHLGGDLARQARLLWATLSRRY
jgi:NADH dehydrogenase [ubiquinone] 1 alpha subcomplex assembly factor 6